MKTLRSLHLYLGCIFAPMMLFFVISGFWQTWYPPFVTHSATLDMLSTIHTRMTLKIGYGLSNPILCFFVLVMAVSFIFSTLLGIVMAVRHGSRKAAWGCLAFGILCPLAIIIIPLRLRQHAQAQIATQDNIIFQLATAAADGDTNAMTGLAEHYHEAMFGVAKSADRGGEMNAIRGAFDNLGYRAGQGNDNALHALLDASQMDEFQGFAVDALGKAAGMGNQAALEPLLHPTESHILPSGAVLALQPAADDGNQKAIEALASDADDPAFSYEAAVGLQKAATTGANSTAIDALALVAKNGNDDARKLAMTALETASSNHIDRATEDLNQLKSQ